MKTTQSLQDKVILITGGGTGIGRGAALALAGEKARVVVCGRRADRLEQVVSAIRASGGAGLAVPTDVSDPGQVERLVKNVMETHGRIDVLINNAGIFEGGSLQEIDVAAWDQVMQTNLRAPFLLTRQVLPIMRQQSSGHIINISSESGIEYYPEDGVYGVSKHALNAFGEYIQRQNQAFNIRVNTICPGMVVTEMADRSQGLDREKCLYPEDIADLIIWLLTRRPNVKIGTPILIQTMLNPWE